MQTDFQTMVGDLSAGVPPSGNDGAVGGPRFADQGDGTVIDNATRLQWSKATLTPTRISQHEALKLCEGLSLAGYGDWRLPTRAEMLTLADDTRHEPAIDTALFPDTKPDWYWTSTVCAWSSAHAWVVSFDGCDSYFNRGLSNGLVRAVRSVPEGAVRSVPEGMVMVQRADLAALEATDFGRCGWSVRADLAARRLRDGLLAAALAAKGNGNAQG